MKSHRSALSLICCVIAALGAGCASLSTDVTEARRVINLDGTWHAAEGQMDSVPASFDHEVPVPGLLDMAEPAFADVGKKSEKRRAFWYRRNFSVKGEIPDVAILKIHKAKYGTKVWLNGQVVGEHLPCFTPALLNVRECLNGSGEQNELIIRVGADREVLGEGIPAGWDFEKYLYIPGIYDSVELILTRRPYIVNVQTVPDIDSGQVRVVAEIDNGERDDEVALRYVLREARTARIVHSGSASATGKQQVDIDFTIPIRKCRLWSPENPFLYELELTTLGDYRRVRFGMRSFRFDKETGRAILNGKPYFMRGTNVCVYRFFEDAQRGDKPWRAEWVRRLHRKFKSMHWNSIRYCIGFPPEIWYEIADEEGFLIQDEFPIWLLGKAPENPKSEKIVPEYREWMRERWNHPCVVIWDAQNESVTEETGKAIQAVRDLDLSGRPWENGWARPQSEADCIEAHPYFFSKLWKEYWADDRKFALSDLAKTSGRPGIRKEQENYHLPIIIYEYGWLWLNRDGSTTCLTGSVYERLLGPDSTVAGRRLLYARYLAALTEFWRCHRECAGVLHFCGLGYSRAGDKPRPEGGATSDHFVDLERLTFEPHFERYVRDSFSPVGLMIDFWQEKLGRGQEQEFKVVVVNDLYEDWKGTLLLRIVRGDRTVTEQSVRCKVDGLGREVVSLKGKVPQEAGKYRLVAELALDDGERVRSQRDFEVVSTR